MDEAEVLAGRLLASGSGPVEDRGATAVLAAVSGTVITAVMRSRCVRELTGRERVLLRPPGVTRGHERRGVLCAGPVPAAAVSAVILPGRLPARVREVLGIAVTGAARPGDQDVPLGRALRGLGVRREPLDIRLTPGLRDAGGGEVVLASAARLWLAGAPVALVTEHVYAAFVAAFPGPGRR